MTDKWIIENGEIKDTTTNMTFDSFVEIITVLNGQSRRITELASDNKRLKFQLNDCLNKKLFSRRELEKENEQLKTTIQQLRTDNTKQKKKLNTTMKENEQLKIALKDKKNLISICEKKFKELGYLITCDDDGYTVEKI